MKVCRMSPYFQSRLLYSEHYIAARLRSLGVKTTFFSSDVADPLIYSDPVRFEPGVSRSFSGPLYRAKCWSMLNKPIFPAQSIRCAIQEGEYQTIHLTGIASPLTLSVLHELGKSGSRKQLIFSDHSTTDTSARGPLSAAAYYRVFKEIVRRHRRRIGIVVTISESSKALLCDRFGLDDNTVTTVPLGFDELTYKYSRARDDESRANHINIGFAGKVDQRKRLDRLIDACGQLPFRDRVRCHIAGLLECESSVRLELIKRAKANSVSLIPYPLLAPKLLADFYNSLDFAVFPGSVSITTLEASGCGVPVLLYKSIAGLEGRVESERGFLFETNAELANLIRHLASREEKEASRAERARRTAIEYSWSTIAQRYLRLYESVASTG